VIIFAVTPVHQRNRGGGGSVFVPREKRQPPQLGVVNHATVKDIWGEGNPELQEAFLRAKREDKLVNPSSRERETLDEKGDLL